MIAIDPDEIIVEDTGTEFTRHADLDPETFDQLKHNVDIHQQWGMRIPEQGGIAYIRISPQLRDFFELCHEKHGVIGFEYDFDEASLNFGLILRKNKE